MTEVILYGNPLSTYTRAARLTLVEKEVAYDLVEEQPGTPENIAHQPFGKIPSLTHGDFHLYETIAIMRYVDAAFDGPALQPKDVRMQAMVDQWLSATVSYIYPTLVGKLIIPRLVRPQRDIDVDESAIKGSMDEFEQQLLILSGALQEHSYFSGDTAGLADFMLMPILYYVNFTPEGRQLVGRSPRLLRWLETMGKRSSDKATLPLLEAA